MSNQDYDQNQSPDQTAQGQDQFGQQQQYDASGQMDQGQSGQGYGGSFDPSTQQQGQYGQSGGMSGQGYDQSGQMGQMGGQPGQDRFGGARQAAEGQVDNAIDQFANRIPGGAEHAQQAKDAANQGIDNLEQEAENRMGNAGGGIGGTLGGMFGGNAGDQGGQQ
jgi:hypothetical protein